MSSNQFPFAGRLRSLQFYVMSDKDREDQSFVSVKYRHLNRGLTPADDGLADPNMGTSEMEYRCRTCGNRKASCPGHPGIYHLNIPIKNPLAYMGNNNMIINWLKIICFNCRNLVAQINTAHISNHKALMKFYIEKTKSLSKCQYCQHPKGSIVTDKDYVLNIYEEFKDAKKFTSKKTILTNEFIRQIFESIPDEIINKLSAQYAHPRKYIMSSITIIPTAARPDNRSASGVKNPNPITKVYSKIINLNTALIESHEERSEKQNAKLAKELESEVFILIKGTDPTKSDKEIVSIAKQLVGKTGEIRGYMLGKRCNQTARSVIIGSTEQGLNTVGVPHTIAKIITIPETVNGYNYDRLNEVFMRRSAFPGCTKLTKKTNNRTYDIDYIPSSYKLQMGDILHRHLFDGDVIMLGRQPSLLDTSIATFRVKVIYDSDAFKLNPSVCILFNADFDGDQMTGKFPISINARAEASLISPVEKSISIQNISGHYGAFQDTLIGLAVLTMNRGAYIDKYHAMAMLSDTQHYPSLDESKLYAGYDMTSALLPKNINLVKRTPKFYSESLVPYIKYKREDISVNIIRGQHISGVLDKGTSGQGSRGSLFHHIQSAYGGKVACDILYEFQLMISTFLLYEGFTVSIRDVEIKPDDQIAVQEATQKILYDAQQITEDLDNYKIIPPIGETLRDYYEQLQVNALQPGDDYTNIIFNSLGAGFNENGITRLVLFGSKGGPGNLQSLNCSLGAQDIGGIRPPKNFGIGRSSVFYQRFDMSPEANGYVKSSFNRGLAAHETVATSMAGRRGLSKIALSTSISGTENRNSVKNLESLITDHLLRVSKNDNIIIQYLYGETGIDPRKLESCNLPTVMMSNENFQKYKLHDKEFETLRADRAWYREMMRVVEAGSPGRVFVTDKTLMPVNIERMMHNMQYNELYADQSSDNLDPDETYGLVNELCQNFAYLYMNRFQERKRAHIPSYIEAASMVVKIYIRSQLSLYNLRKHNFSIDMLKILIRDIRNVFKLSLMAPGSCVGIFAAQCSSEPLVQQVIDSKHSVGLGGGFGTNTMDRYKEIIGVRTTDKMKNPTMRLAIVEPLCYDRIAVQLISNKIEMIKFGQLVIEDQILIETVFGEPVYPKIAASDKLLMESFKFNHAGFKIDPNLSAWVIRYELDPDEINTKSITLLDMVLKLQSIFDKEVFIVHSDEQAIPIVIKFYVKNSVIEKAEKDMNKIKKALIKLRDTIFDTIIGGIEDIIRTNIIKVEQYTEDADGSYVKKPKFYIETLGTNLPAVYDIPEIDPYNSYTDSIWANYELFGIEKTRDVIVYEIINTMNKVIPLHASMYADEMTSLGVPTSIGHGGMDARGKNNVLQKSAFKSPLGVLANAAANGTVDTLSGVSAALMTGIPPKIGTLYSDYIIDPEFHTHEKANINNTLDLL